MDALIAATELSNSKTAVQDLAMCSSLQLPVLWIPDYPLRLSDVSQALKGHLPQGADVNVRPQYWAIS